MVIEVIKHLWEKPWFHEALLLLFFASVFLWKQIIATERFLRWQIKKQPDNADARFKLGMLLCEDDECYEESEMEFRRAISIDPQNKEAYGQLFLVQDRAQKAKDVEQTLNQMMELFPDDPIVYTGKEIRLKIMSRQRNIFKEQSHLPLRFPLHMNIMDIFY